MFKLTHEEFGGHLAKRLKKTPRSFAEQVNELANSLVFMLVEMCTFGVISHVAASLGTRTPRTTLKEVVDQQDRFAIRTLNSEIQLDHFRNFPEQLLFDLFEESEGNLLMQTIIKDLAVNRLSYFHCPHDVSHPHLPRGWESRCLQRSL